MKKATIIDVYENEIIQEAFDKLDLDFLNREIQKLFGFEISLTKELTSYRCFNRDKLKIKIFCEDNLIDKCGVMQYGLQSAYLQDFGVHIRQLIEYDNDKLEEERSKNLDSYIPVTAFSNTLDILVYVTLDIRYTLKNGGSNGITILSASYEVNANKWTIHKCE